MPDAIADARWNNTVSNTFADVRLPVLRHASLTEFVHIGISGKFQGCSSGSRKSHLVQSRI